MVWQVLLLGTQTVTLVKGSLTAVKVCGCGPASTVIGVAFTGLIVTIAVPDLEVFCVEVPVMVTVVGDKTTGAVKTPLVLMEPAVAVQVTVVRKVPVPVTAAAHWFCWPDWIGEGKQVTVTPVTVDVVVELQAAIHNTIPTTNKSANLRILLVSLPDVAGLYVLRYQLGNVCLAAKAARMSRLLDHQTRCVN